MSAKRMNPPPRLTDLTQPEQMKLLNDFLKDLWSHTYIGNTETIQLNAALPGQAQTLVVKDGQIVDKTVMP